MAENKNELYQSVDEVRSRVINKVVSYSTPKTIASIIEIFIAIVCSCGIQMVSFGLSLEAFYEWSFYVKTIAMTICVFLLYRGVVNAVYNKTENRESVKSIKERYIELNKNKTLQMKEYLKIFNNESKIECYINSINRKIAKYEKKIINCKNRRKRERYEEIIGSDEPGYVSGLKKLITTDYIASNISNIHIKYPIVYYNDFTEVNDVGNRAAIETDPKYDRAFNKYSFKKVWCYLICSAMFGISMIGFENQSKTFFFASILMTICMIVVRIATALAEAPKIYDTTITKSYSDRIYVLERFIEWKNNPQTIENEVLRQKAKDDLLKLDREMIRAEEAAKAREQYKTEYEAKYKLAIEEYIKQYEN